MQTNSINSSRNINQTSPVYTTPTKTMHADFINSSISKSPCSCLKSIWNFLVSIPKAIWGWLKSICGKKSVPAVPKITDSAQTEALSEEFYKILIKPIFNSNAIDKMPNEWKAIFLVETNGKKTLINTGMVKKDAGSFYEKEEAKKLYNHIMETQQFDFDYCALWVGKENLNSFQIYRAFGHFGDPGYSYGSSTYRADADTIQKCLTPHLPEKECKKLLQFLTS